MIRRPWRRGTPQQAVSAQIFIDIGPVDTMAPASDFPPLPLFRRSVEQARIPCQWDGDGASVHEIDCQAVVVNGNRLHTLVSFGRRNIHTMPPIAVSDGHEPDAAVLPTASLRSHIMALSTWASARSLPSRRLNQHGRTEVRSPHGCRNTTDIRHDASPSAWSFPGS